MIKAVVFDLDHTLYDRYETMKKVAPFLPLKLKINPKYTVSEIADIMINIDKNFVHKSWKTVQDEICKTGLFLQEPGPNEYLNAVMDEFMHIAVPFSFTIPMLEKLKEQGYKTALITNGSSELQNSKIDMLGLRSYLDYIYIGGEHEWKKPNIEPFLITAEKLGLKPNECVYVGDHPKNDIEASRKAGYLPIHVQTTGNWVLPEIERPEYSVKTVEEIPEIVEKINREH